MKETWATFGADLHLDLTDGHGRAALERALREAIQSGRLHPGTRLPSSRALAQDLSLARNTIVEAYGQLVAEGWLTAVTGSGTHVAERAAEVHPPITTAVPTRAPRFDLRPGFPDLTTFPRAAWLTAARRALNTAPYEALGYGDPRGRPELREALAAYLSRARGVRTDADRIVVCSGFAQALPLLCRVLAARGGTTIAIENYGHGSHRDAAVASGLRPAPVALDSHGVIASALGDADAALLTPAHQFPLGMALAAARRTQVAGWAAEQGAVIIEDDYDGEFRYDRQAIGAMQALAPNHIVYAGTGSKTLAPGLRLAWLVLPAHLVDDVASAKSMADGNSSSLDQLTMAEFITSGAYDRHVRRCRLLYRRRRDRLVSQLHGRFPISGVSAGLHAVVELPRDWSEDGVVARAADRGLALRGLSSFAMGAADRGPALVIGYGTPPAHAYTSALARLVATLSM